MRSDPESVRFGEFIDFSIKIDNAFLEIDNSACDDPGPGAASL